MKRAKHFSIFIFAALLSYGGLSFYLLPQATFQGDLTRVGLLPESEFGWRLAQPKIDHLLLNQSTLREADVLVIGDSFSDSPGQPSLVWQTVLTQHNLKVRTERWENFGGVCADFMPWIRKQGFKGKYLILESVERGLMVNLNNSISCKLVQYRSNAAINSFRFPPATSFDVSAGDYSGKLSTAIRTRVNLIKYDNMKQAGDFKSMSLSNNIKLARVGNGCELFSHRSCKDALFLGEDQTTEIDMNALDKIEEVNFRLNGVTTIWAIVPNKSTAYLYPDKQFWRMNEQRTHAPNLLQMTQDAINHKIIDLYPANNTHFSTTGFLLMGQMIYGAMH